MAGTEKRTTHHHGNLKEALVAYALGAAREGTIETLSLRQASRALGVSPGAVYRHVPDKDALMRALATTAFDMLAAEFEAILPFDSDATTGAEAKARFIALASAYAAFAVEHYGLWRLMFGPYGRQSDRKPKDRADTYDWLEKSLAELAAAGLITKTGPDAQFFAWTTIHGMSDLQASPAIQEKGREKVVGSQCELILSALR